MPDRDSEPTSDVGEFIAQSKQNATALKELRSEVSEGLTDLRKGIDRLSERLYTSTRPNFTTMIALAGIILTVIGMVSAPIGFFFWNAIRDLDTKLQNEYRLSIATATQGVQNLNEQSKERHDSAIKYVDMSIGAVQKNLDRLWQAHDSQVQSDLDELRQRRMRDGAKP